MNSEKRIEVSLNREQLINAIVVYLEGLGIYRGREIIDMEVFGLPKTPLIPLTFKLKEIAP